MDGWLACLTELSIPEDNPTWAKVAPTPELPEPLEPYSSMILSGFNKEEYMNHRSEDEDAANAIVAPGNELSGGKKREPETLREGMAKWT